MDGHKKLLVSKKERKDEFYTQLSDIEIELRHYKHHFKDKVVLCNCDDPYESNFFKYFALNFNSLGLKKLIVTGYTTSPVLGNELDVWTKEESPIPTRTPYVAYINEVIDLNGDGRIDLEDVKILLTEKHNCRRKLYGEVVYDNGKRIEYPAGDFRSSQCVKLLEQADIVCTNPPFSLFRVYVPQLMKFNKKFIILGNPNALTYKEIFPLIQDNKLWLGNKSMGTDMLFDVPSYYAEDLIKNKKEGSAYKIVNGIVKGRTQAIWFTNLDIFKRHEVLVFYKKYNSEDYPKYDNYDAINVNKVADIPYDYDGVMGVPISFLDKYNPEQFEILNFWNNGAAGEKVGAKKIKILSSGKQLLWNGPVVNGKATYFRVLIQKKH